LSDPPCPANVSLADCVPLSAPSPRERLSRSPSIYGLIWLPNRLSTALSLLGSANLLYSPARLPLAFRVRHTSVSGFPRPWLIIRIPYSSFLRTLPWPGVARASQVLNASLHAYHALRGPRQTLLDLTSNGPFVLASGTLTPSPSASIALTGLYQDSGSAVSPAVYVVCTLQLCRSALHLYLLHSCNTRYEWLAKPYSAGTFTLQEAPSFAWRTNV